MNTSRAVFADGILKDHVAFVTGGGTGITGGVARALAEAGANVALVSRSIEHLEPAAKAINEFAQRDSEPLSGYGSSVVERYRQRHLVTPLLAAHASPFQGR